MNHDLWGAFPELGVVIKVPLLVAIEISFVGMLDPRHQPEALPELSLLSTRPGCDRSMGFDYQQK